MTRLRLPNASKYGNRRTELNGRTYASKAEAKRAQELQLMERAGEIRDLRYQVRYPLKVNEVAICTYVSDFEYEQDGAHIVEDVKGHATREYAIKKRLMLAQYGIEIQEVRA